MKTKRSFFQSAQDNWPEDEAARTVQSLANRLEDYPDDLPWCRAGFTKDIEHMERCLNFERDGPSLIARYRAAINAELAARNISGFFIS